MTKYFTSHKKHNHLKFMKFYCFTNFPVNLP